MKLHERYGVCSYSSCVTYFDHNLGHCEGIGLNCGCPQRWVNQLNYGDILMKQPDRLADILAAARRAVPDNDFCIELKMRVFNDLEPTVELGLQLMKFFVRMIDDYKFS